MRKILRQLSIMSSRSSSGWLTLMLLLAVLVPSVCLIWFMNQAMRNERLAVRQELMEVYRANLALAQARLEAWRTKIIHDTETNDLPGPELFAKIARTGLADAAICSNAAGAVIYPARTSNAPASLPGLALQAEARNLFAAGKSRAAQELLAAAVKKNALSGAADEQGRLILPNLELMAIQTAPGNAADLRTALQTTLNDYGNGMPASQRRFLMRQLMTLFPKEITFTTFPAEDLAAQFLDAGSKSPPPDVWPLAAPARHTLLLFKTGTLETRSRDAAISLTWPTAVSLDFIRPGQDTGKYLLVVPMGEDFPGWQIALALKDGNIFNTAANEQIASYLWVGLLTTGAVAVLALLGARLIRQQAAVARLRNDLLANVTHELKTPLSSMRLLVDTLLQSNPLHEQTARQYLELIAAENIRLSRLIDNFLAFSRIERNKLAFQFAAVPAGAIAESAAAAVRERFAASGCHFAFQAAPTLPLVQADADALVTVLLNLLDNAWKYSGDDKHILLAAGREKGHVVFTVKDNGIGLSPRESKRIFRRFYQVDQRLARAGGGCGLGLSIVQFIVRAHRGSIRVESEPGQGSAFIVSLPLAPTEAGS